MNRVLDFEFLIFDLGAWRRKSKIENQKFLTLYILSTPVNYFFRKLRRAGTSPAPTVIDRRYE